VASRVTDVYYDTYDVEINANPVYRRLPEGAPLSDNDLHDFYTVSR
jgi:hypothetical protein